MFNKSYRPLLHVINYDNCDYSHLPYRFRQKMRVVESWMLSIRGLSKCDYKLFLFDDGCCLLDPIRNRILWKFDYYSSFAVLRTRLEELYRFYNYEKHSNEKNSNHLKNIISRNDYHALKQKYYGC